MARRRYFPAKYQETIVPSAARTTNGSGTAVQGWARGAGAQSKLDVTAASGTTPQLTVFIEDSPDNSTWTVRDTFGVKTGISNEVRALPAGLDVYQRARWTITGTTPSFTFSVQLASSAAQLL